MKDGNDVTKMKDDALLGCSFHICLFFWRPAPCLSTPAFCDEIRVML